MRVHVVSGASGVKYVYIQEPYRDERGKPRHRTVARLGRLDRLLEEDPQALEKLREQYCAPKRGEVGSVEIDPNLPASSRLANIGWFLVEAAFESLGIGAALRRIGMERWEEHVELIKRFAVSRVLSPTWDRDRATPVDLLFGQFPTEEPAQDLVDEFAIVMDQLVTHVSSRVSGGPRHPAFCFLQTQAFAAALSDLGEPADMLDGSPAGQLATLVLTDREGAPLGMEAWTGANVVEQAMARVLQLPHRCCVIGPTWIGASHWLEDLASAGHDWVYYQDAAGARPALREWLRDPSSWRWLDADQTSRAKETTTRRKPGRATDGSHAPHRSLEERVIALWSARQAAERFREADAARGGLPQDRPQPRATMQGSVLIQSSLPQATVEWASELDARHSAIKEALAVPRVSDLGAGGRWTPRRRASVMGVVGCGFFALSVSHLLSTWLGLSATDGTLRQLVTGLNVVELQAGRYLLQRDPTWDLVDKAAGVCTDRLWLDIGQLRQLRRDLAKWAVDRVFATHDGD